MGNERQAKANPKKLFACPAFWWIAIPLTVATHHTNSNSNHPLANTFVEVILGKLGAFTWFIVVAWIAWRISRRSQTAMALTLLTLGGMSVFGSYLGDNGKLIPEAKAVIEKIETLFAGAAPKNHKDSSARHNDGIRDEDLHLAFRNAKAAVENELDIEFSDELTLRVVGRDEIATRVESEQYQLFISRGLSKSDARFVAQEVAANQSLAIYAMYSWSTGEILASREALSEHAVVFGNMGLIDPRFYEALMVHELVHADDFRRYEVPRVLRKISNPDTLEAFAAVVEGHAQLQANKICATQGWSDGFDSLRAVFVALPEVLPGFWEETEAISDTDKRRLRQECIQIMNRYIQGEAFMSAVESRGGSDAIEAMFREPPKDMMRILKPDWYDTAINSGGQSNSDTVSPVILGDCVFRDVITNEDEFGLERLIGAGQSQDDLDLGLIHASFEGHGDFAEVLLRAGANPNRPISPGGNTVVCLAADFCRTGVLKLLLDNGGDANVIDRFGWSPLHHTINQDRECPEAILLLGRNGALVDYRTSDGLTALHRAAVMGWTESVKVLLDLGADPSLMDNQGRTAEDRASAAGFKELASYLSRHSD
jgi:hypothetical protein